MYYGYIESESLSDPLVLNSYKPVKVDIEFVPTSENFPHVHAYYLKFRDRDVGSEAKKFAKLTKPEWYLLFWSNKTVYAIFKDKVFKLTNEIEWKSEKYKEVQKNGVNHGIGMVYMNFNKNFARFNQVLSKKNSRL